MENLKTKSIISAIAVSLVLASCKAPMVTVVKDEVKNNLPQNFNQQETEDSGNNSGTTPWRQFFTDPNLVNLIETALKNNQDLLITFQQIEIAKSGVLAKKGMLNPTVSAGVNAGLKKAGRYTSEGAGDATTEIEPGRKMPDHWGVLQVALRQVGRLISGRS